MVRELDRRPWETQEPAISTVTAVTLPILYTLIYVLPFYVSSTTRPSPTISRDAPNVIKSRIRIVTVSCLVSISITASVISASTESTTWTNLHLLGLLQLFSLSSFVKPLCLTAILFAGPLYEREIVEGGWREWMTLSSARETLSEWTGYRNFVAGPLTEELLFRSAMTPLLILSPISQSAQSIILLNPLPFGLAHIHHFYEFTLTHPDTSLVPALLRSLFQFGFTTVFGWLATFIFLRTGNVWVCFLVHSFCNWMGLPRVWGRLESGVLGPAGIGGGGSGDGQGEQELGWSWTALYYILLIGGAVGFWQCLWVLTDVGSRQALIDF